MIRHIMLLVWQGACNTPCMFCNTLTVHHACASHALSQAWATPGVIPSDAQQVQPAYSNSVCCMHSVLLTGLLHYVGSWLPLAGLRCWSHTCSQLQHQVAYPSQQLLLPLLTECVAVVGPAHSIWLSACSTSAPTSRRVFPHDPT